MKFYDLSKEERTKLVDKINHEIERDLKANRQENILNYFSDDDTYIRKTGYLAIGKLFYANKELQSIILKTLKGLFTNDVSSVRQTTVNAAGEIGKSRFNLVQSFFDKGLFDKHHSVRNAVIGSMKKMGEKNPDPILSWAKKYLEHPDKEIRREICHGIELRGRTHPQDVLPLLKELQFDEIARVRNTLIHVLGQISYKNGCLKTVVKELNSWKNKDLVQEALDEIVDVHRRYAKFTALTQQEAVNFIDKHYGAA